MASQRSSFSDISRLPAILLAALGTSLLLVTAYFLHYYSWTGQRQFTSSAGIVFYYILTPVLASLLFASLKLSRGYQIIICVLSISLIATAYGAELYLRYTRLAR